jgi:hypothetical protein
MGGSHLLGPNNIEAEVHQPSNMSSAGVFSGRWRITTVMGFSDLGKKEK